MTEKCRPIGGKEKGNERGKKIKHENCHKWQVS